MNFPKFWAQGRSGNFTSWRWSDTSLQEAQALAQQNAERIAVQFSKEGRPLDRYAYADRPLREPVLREMRSANGDLAAVITRNSYGCQVMNTSRAMFVDVDLPESSGPPKSGGLFSSLFGSKPQPVMDPMQAAMAKAEDWARKQSGWDWRIYRTQAGLRLLATHDLFAPSDPVCEAVFEAVGADPLYRQLCYTQECFRARLTPKPWRCEMKNPPARWPFANRSDEAAFNSWDAEYQSACQAKSTCKMLTAGSGYVHPDLQALVTLHDEMTRIGSPLPLA